LLLEPWNFLPEVTGDLGFPSRVAFHDITLRDGEQQAGVIFNREDKVQIAKCLATTGVDRIDAGMPIVSPSDEAAIKDIVQLDLGPEVYAFARCMVSDIQKAKECGVTGVVVEIPSSQHLVEHGYGWKFDRAIYFSIETTQAAHAEGLKTVFFAIDSSRAEMDWYLDLIERVATEGHMDALALVDTFGVVSTNATPFWVRKVRERLPYVTLEAHLHDDFGLAVANTIAAVAAGVEVVHTTVTGIGEWAGNCPMEELALALRMMYEVEHDIDARHFYSLSRLVRERAGHLIPSNRAVVGERLSEIESGIIAGWYYNCIKDRPLELFPYHWDEVGQPTPRLVCGKGSGLPSLDAVPGVGPDALDGLRRTVLAKVKERSASTKTLVAIRGSVSDRQSLHRGELSDCSGRHEHGYPHHQSPVYGFIDA
jgi:isopropylmalate/homocitrate/citramalate synthase